MAVVAYASNDAKLAERCGEIIEDWIRENPPFLGVNWNSGIELGLRAISILLVAELLGVSAFPTKRWERVVCSLASHAYWLARFPSKYSSANNHRIAEATGLYVIGTLLPSIPQAASYANSARVVLENEAQLQIHPDGVGAEHAPRYSAFVLELLMLAYAVAKRTDAPFSDALRNRIELGAAFLADLLDARGDWPRIGDDDTTRVFYDEDDSRYLTSIVNSVNALLDVSLAVPPSDPSIRSLIFGYSPNHGRPELGVTHYPTGGYTVIRDSCKQRQVLAVFDHGPLGYLSIAAHGHADALSFWLHLDGQPVFVDAGTYLYFGSPKWRSYFRATRAHNTLCIDGEGASIEAGSFNWLRKANVRVTALDLTAANKGRWLVAAEHDGYRGRGIVHRRVLEGTGPGNYVITDSLYGSWQCQRATVGFLLHPDLVWQKVSERHWAVTRGNRIVLHVAVTGDGLGDNMSEVSACVEAAWYSPKFGAIEQTTRLVVSAVLRPAELLITHVTVGADRDGLGTE
jgi:uncharacterized heparinase superfamily protein